MGITTPQSFSVTNTSGIWDGKKKGFSRSASNSPQIRLDADAEPQGEETPGCDKYGQNYSKDFVAMMKLTRT